MYTEFLSFPGDFTWGASAACGAGSRRPAYPGETGLPAPHKTGGSLYDNFERGFGFTKSLISYVDDRDAEAEQSIVAGIKIRFPKERIKVFLPITIAKKNKKAPLNTAL
jgi:hypothetical protein